METPKREEREPAKEGEEFEPGPGDRLDERVEQLGPPEPQVEVRRRDGRDPDDDPPPLAA